MTRQRCGACQPGATPRGFVRVHLRPERAEDSCALAGRTGQFRNLGRCPGLERGGAFSAGIKDVQIRIHESYAWPFIRWLTVETETTNHVAGQRFFVAPASRQRSCVMWPDREIAGETPAPLGSCEVSLAHDSR